MGCGVIALTGHSRLIFVEETGSTNSDMLERVAAAGAVPADEWLIAARQSAGRGRLGRLWDSRTGNFHGSTVVTLSGSDPASHSLALVTAIAVHSAILDVTRGLVRPSIKWPNDLLIGSAKIAGILLERQGDAVVVGVGCNLAFAPQIAGRATISLDGLGHNVPVRDFAECLADTFMAELAVWRTQGLASTVQRWNERAIAAGTLLTVSDGPQAGLTGAFDGLEQNGNLRLKLADGGQVVIIAGEVRLAGPQA